MLGTFGVHGHLKCAYTTDNPELLAQRGAYILVEPRTSECIPVTPVEVQLRKDNFLIRFEGHDAPEPLKFLSGWELTYPARIGELPREEGEIYYFELLGMEVRRPDGAVLGRVIEVSDSGAHVLLEIDTSPPRLIPFIQQHVPEVNLEEGWLITTYPLDDTEAVR